MSYDEGNGTFNLVYKAATAVHEPSMIFLSEKYYYPRGYNARLVVLDWPHVDIQFEVDFSLCVCFSVVPEKAADLHYEFPFLKVYHTKLVKDGEVCWHELKCEDDSQDFHN